MVTTRPSSSITMPWPSRSEPRVWAERRSSGMVVCRPTTAGSTSTTSGGRLLSPPGRRASTPRSLPCHWLEPFAEPFKPRAMRNPPRPGCPKIGVGADDCYMMCMAPPADPFEITDDPVPGPEPRPATRVVAPSAHLEGLNEEQRLAVIHEGGPLLVLAGAGTGKTRVLTTRIAHQLITGRARPSQILAVTFTNKAAREMLDRVAQLIGGAADGMWLGTFHSVGVRVLRRHAELVGLKSNFTILDTDDQTRLIKQLLQAEGIDDKKWPARVLSGIIQRWKDRALTPDKVATDDAGEFANGKAAEIYKQYQARLAEVNAVDFGDLVMHCVTPVAAASRRAGAIPPPLPPHPGRRVPGHQRGAVSVAAPAGAGHAGRLLRRRRRPVDLRLARRRGRQHPALREGLPRRHHRAPRAQLPLDAAHPRRRLAPDRPQRGAAGQDAVDRIEGRRAHLAARRVGRRRGGAPDRRGDRGAAARQASAQPDRHPGARRLPDPRVRGALHHHGPALSRDRRPALLRAAGDPRRDGLLPRHRAARRRPRLRAHLQHAAPRAGRIGAAHAAHHPARPEGVAVRGDAAGARDRRAQGPPAQVAGRPDPELRPLARHARRHEPCRGGRDDPRRVRATPTCCAPTARPRPRAGWRT